MMHGAVVAIEASVDGYFRGKCAGCLDVARGTFIFKNGVWLGQMPAAVNARVFQDSTFGDPEESEQRQQEAEPEFRALQRRRPLGIIRVDTLPRFFCCSCSRHSSLATSLIAQRHDRMNDA